MRPTESFPDKPSCLAGSRPTELPGKDSTTCAAAHKFYNEQQVCSICECHPFFGGGFGYVAVFASFLFLLLSTPIKCICLVPLNSMANLIKLVSLFSEGAPVQGTRKKMTWKDETGILISAIYVHMLVCVKNLIVKTTKFKSSKNEHSMLRSSTEHWEPYCLGGLVTWLGSRTPR